MNRRRPRFVPTFGTVMEALETRLVPSGLVAAQSAHAVATTTTMAVTAGTLGQPITVAVARARRGRRTAGNGEHHRPRHPASDGHAVADDIGEPPVCVQPGHIHLDATAWRRCLLLRETHGHRHVQSQRRISRRAARTRSSPWLIPRDHVGSQRRDDRNHQARGRGSRPARPPTCSTPDILRRPARSSTTRAATAGRRSASRFGAGAGHSRLRLGDDRHAGWRDAPRSDPTIGRVRRRLPTGPFPRIRPSSSK